MKNIHYGAGNIGRGFIGYFLHKSNYEVTFVDVNEKVIQELNNSKEYTITELSKMKTTHKIKNICGINSATNKEDLINSLVNTDLITTAMGINNLKYIKDDIISMVERCIKLKITKHVNIICCENGIRVSSEFKKLVIEGVSTEHAKYINSYIHFVDTAVDRIIPNQVNENIIDVSVEPYFEWVIDKTQMYGEENIIDVVYTKNLDYYNQRKLLTVNSGHAACAYIGFVNSKTLIFEVLEDKILFSEVYDFLKEIQNALSYRFDFNSLDHEQYILETLKRFQNPYLIDEITRVGRNPITKLSEKERLIAPLNLLLENNDYNYLAIINVINACLNYDVSSDLESVKMQNDIGDIGKKSVFTNITNVSSERVINLIK